ncbi:uncharacterized protein ACNLHF_007157 [Anomaloglossus baeobatrachus]
MHLLRELQDTHPHDFRNYLRMSEEYFLYIVSKVKPYIARKDTVMRPAVPVEERVAVTLRFLATGRSLTDIQYSSAISRSLLSSLIPETCVAIINSLRDYMPYPGNSQDWAKIGDDFNHIWQFPNCGGAIDGKHIRITQPHNSGSFFYNYKGYYSLILMALVNAHYEFITVDVGINGRVSDGGVFERTVFGQRLKNNQIPFPSNIENINNLNFVILADEAFPLHKNMLNPYPLANLNQTRRIFNYRLSRARLVVENAFGIMASRFRIFYSPINMKLSSIDSVVLACCILHNFLRKKDATSYMPSGYADADVTNSGDITLGTWRDDAVNLASLSVPSHFGRRRLEAMENRDLYCTYFNTTGAVNWQADRI